MDRSRFIDDIRAAEKQNLKKFMLDLVDYCLKAVGLQWPTPDEDGLHQRVLFETYMGDTILRHRNAHDEQFRTTIRQATPLQNITDYVFKYMKVHFESNGAKETHCLLFGFCAFLVDTAVFCCRYRRPELVPLALEAAAEVHGLYLGDHGEEHLWREFKFLLQSMNQCYQRLPKAPKVDQLDEDCESFSEDSLNSTTEDLVICLDRRRVEKEAKRKENSNTQ